MTVNDDIKLTKGIYSVTLFTNESTENFKNALTVKPSVISPAKQSSGSKKAMVVDLLRITHTFVIHCYIVRSGSKTAKEIKRHLIKIFEGGGVGSSPVKLTYEDEEFDVFFEDCVIKKINNDNIVETNPNISDSAEYSVTLTLVEGRLVGQ